MYILSRFSGGVKLRNPLQWGGIYDSIVTFIMYRYVYILKRMKARSGAVFSRYYSGQPA